MNRNVKSSKKTVKAASNGHRRKRRRGKRTLHYIILLMFMLAAGCTLCLTVFFKIEAVYAVGTDRYDPLDIVAESGIQIGDNLFRIDKAAVSQAILDKYPYVEKVDVYRYLPATVEIHVTPSVPTGAIKEGDNYILITQSGKVLERGIVYIPVDIPLIIGIDTKGIMPGDYLGAWEREEPAPQETKEQKEARRARDKKKEEKANLVNEALIMLEYLFEAAEECGFEQITNVDVTDRLNMKVVYENRLVLLLGSESEMKYKLDFLSAVIEKLEPGAKGTLNAANIQNKKIIFQPAPGYAPVNGHNMDDLQTTVLEIQLEGTDDAQDST